MNSFGYKRSSILKIALLCLAAALLIGTIQGSTLVVDKNNPNAYQSINQAIQKSNDGDIIEVHGGIYTENLVINKRLTLRGVPKEGGKPIVDFRPYASYGVRVGGEDFNYWGILVNASSVIFEGFDLIGKEDCDYGIIINSNNTTIRGDNITDLKEGIFVNGSGNILSENSITNCKDKGIYLKRSSDNIIVGNIITGNAFGVWIGDHSSSNLIYCNNFTNNRLNAYDLDASNNWNNEKTGNYYGDFHLPEQGCYDTNHNNICDDPYVIQGKYPNNGSIDEYPSVIQRSPPCCPLRVQVIPSRNNATIGQNVTITYLISNYGWSRLGNIYLNSTKMGEFPQERLKLEPDQMIKISQNYTVSDSDFPGSMNIAVRATGMDYSTFKEVNATASASIKISIGPRICIKVMPSVNEAEAGQEITYKYIISNCGDVPLSDVLLNDSKMNGYIINSTKLEPNMSLNISRSYIISDSDLPGPLNDTAQATGKDNLTESKVVARNSASIRILPSDLVLSMSADLLCTRNLSDRINFTIAVKNNGTGKAKGLVVHDSIPDNSEFISAYPLNYDPNTGNWYLDSLAAGETAKFYLEVEGGSIESVNNNASVTSRTNDSNEMNNYYLLNITKCPQNITSEIKLAIEPNEAKSDIEEIQRKIDIFRHSH